MEKKDNLISWDVTSLASLGQQLGAKRILHIPCNLDMREDRTKRLRTYESMEMRKKQLEKLILR